MRFRGISKITLAMICAFALMVGVGGCLKKPGKTKDPFARYSGNYTTIANVRCKELYAVARLSQETPSACTMVFESPPSLNDMAFTFRQDSVDVSYKDMEFTFAPDSMPAGAIAGLVVSAINKAMSGDSITTEADGGLLTVNGFIESGEFSLTLDNETGNLIKLSIPGEELEIEFEDFRFLG